MRFKRAMWFPSPLDPLRKSTAWLWLDLPTWRRYWEPSWLKARLTACPGEHHRTATCCQAYTLEISDRTQQNTKHIQDQKVLFCLTQKLQAFLGWSIQTQEGLVKYSFRSPKRQKCFGIIVSFVEFKNTRISEATSRIANFFTHLKCWPNVLDPIARAFHQASTTCSGGHLQSPPKRWVLRCGRIWQISFH